MRTTAYILVDRRTKRQVFTEPSEFGWMTEAALYAIQHDLIHTDAVPKKSEQTSLQQLVMAVE